MTIKMSERTSRNLTFAMSSEARLSAMARATGIPRGRIVEMALSCVDICTDCNGEGTDDDGHRCAACGGTRIVPCGGES